MEEHKDNPLERENWFYEQRTYPLKGIPAGARQKAFERLEEMRRAERQRAQSPGTEALISANLITWTPIGPQPGAFPRQSLFGHENPTNGRQCGRLLLGQYGK